MDRDKQQRLDACLREAAQILYEETPSGELQDLESMVVLQKLLEDKTILIACPLVMPQFQKFSTRILLDLECHLF